MFNLSYIILDREDLQSVDAFGAAVLDDDNNDLDEAPHDSDANLGNVSIRCIESDLFPNQLLVRHVQLKTRRGGLPNYFFQPPRTSEIGHQKGGQRRYRQGLQLRP